MAINNKLKAFVRYANGKVVAGSLVTQAKKPAVGKWEEIPMYKCCVPEDILLQENGDDLLQEDSSRILL
jgi:hypothetical protein